MESVDARRWWARASLGLVAAGVVLLLSFAAEGGLWLLVATTAVTALVVAALYWFLVQRGLLRWLALAVVVAAPAALVAGFVAEGLVWAVVAGVALKAAAVAAARVALAPRRDEWELPVEEAPPARRPFLVMNPRSGGGKVGRFGLVAKAEALGAEVAVLDRPGTDVQQLARDALDRGADLLGVAGGDGTQALVAQVAAEHDVPFVVVSAGTRNHFALDLGLDREDPSRCLDALTDGVEARIDLGDINGRTFVNNASFGAYAEIVENPAYRDGKTRTALETLPDLLRGRRGAHLVAEAEGVVVEGPHALLVSNNPYEDSDLAGLSRRARLDRGVLGVVSVRVDSARQAVGLMNRAHVRGLVRVETPVVTVRAEQPVVPVGIDGETVEVATPVRCAVRPAVLRVRLPRNRPGIRPPRRRLAWAPLWRLAAGREPGTTGGALPTAGARTSGGYG